MSSLEMTTQAGRGGVVALVSEHENSEDLKFLKDVKEGTHNDN